MAKTSPRSKDAVNSGQTPTLSTPDLLQELLLADARNEIYASAIAYLTRTHTSLDHTDTGPEKPVVSTAVPGCVVDEAMVLRVLDEFEQQWDAAKAEVARLLERRFVLVEPVAGARNKDTKSPKSRGRNADGVDRGGPQLDSDSRLKIIQKESANG